MNLFIMYMAGNTISIFPIMMVCMMAWRPIQALMAMSSTFKLLEGSTRPRLQGAVYLVGNVLGLALAVYKCQAMGLLPTHASDWLAFIEPQQRSGVLRRRNSAVRTSQCLKVSRQRHLPPLAGGLKTETPIPRPPGNLKTPVLSHHPQGASNSKTPITDETGRLQDSDHR
nr:ER membrane protein complex subunit 4 isoform X3 [Petromyzon marinus]XP_032800631.1 ER membrane protein complex subunit 4 isoform X3 [Petromyzon marinus]